MKAQFEAALLAAAFALPVGAQQISNGLRLYQVLGTGETGLVDTAGNIVHQWNGAMHGLSAHLAPDGALMRTGQTITQWPNGVQGAIQRVLFDGTVTWDFRLDGPDVVAHHEIEVMPNGNVLVIAWDVKTVADAIARGRDPALVSGDRFLPDAVYEIRQTGPTTGEVVWEWHMWDHLVQDRSPALPGYGQVDQHPELLDINFPPEMVANGDWNHCNGIDYDPVEDWIVVSARAQSEVYIIDHSTTSAEAAGHTGGRRGKGGDFLYRWGNPHAYGRGTAADQQLVRQHDPRFVPPGRPGAGNMTVFNNQWTATQSAVVEIVLPRDASSELADPGPGSFGPAGPVWSYADPTFQSPFMSSAERLPNGNTLVCSALQNTIFEVTPAGQQVWGRLLQHQGIAVFQSHYVERTFWSATDTLSIQAGGSVEFDSLVSSGVAGQWCLLLGSTLGTSIGRYEGAVHVPLDLDYLYTSMAGSPNRPPFRDTLRQLSPDGHLRSTLAVSPGMIPAQLAGTQLYFAHTVWDAGTFLPLRASNPVCITLTH